VLERYAMQKLINKVTEFVEDIKKEIDIYLTIRRWVRFRKASGK